MELGLSTYSFPWSFGTDVFASNANFSAAQLISYAKGRGISHVQFGDNFPLHKLNLDELHAIRNQAATLKVNLQAGTKRLTVNNILRYLAIAGAIGSPFLRIVIDDHNFHPTEPDIIKIIRNVLPQLESTEIILAIENHDRFSARALERIIENTDINLVGICLDSANSLGAGEGIKEITDILAPYTVNLHIKDFKIARVHHKMGFKVTGTSAGDGMLNIPWLITEVAQYNKCKTATLEVWSEAKDDMKSTFENERKMVDQSIKYLKQIIR